MKNLILTVFIVIAVLSCSCESTEPIDLRQLSIRVEDVSCTEAWITINSSNIDLPTNLNLTANTNLKKQLTLTTQDTIIVIDSLNPGTNYSLQALTGDLSSEKVNAITMDTTSHDFNWQTFTFGGDGGSSYLKDVAIISENNIWAVGEIYENGEKFNAVHWNGSEWELKKIMFYIDQDNTSAGKTPSECNTAFLFDNGHFAISSNVQTALFSTDSSYEIIRMGFLWEDRFTINAIWGISISDCYMVGINGNIAHYDGNTWTKIESGTELDIYDIWGDYNERKGEYEILAVAAKLLHSSDRDILKISENKATRINEEDISQPLRSVWFKSNRLYMVGGSGRYIKRNLSDNLWSRHWNSLTNYFTNKIRGTNLNNIFIIGSFGEVLHYNGFTWHSYLNKELQQFYGELYGISIGDTIVCLVGQDQRECKIYMGKRGGK